MYLKSVWDKSGDDGPKRVLVCGFEKHIVRLIQLNLQRQGYEVSIAGNGPDALALLSRESFDIVVLDSDLPAAERGELEEWLATHEEGKNTKVLPVGARKVGEGVATVKPEAKGKSFDRPFYAAVAALCAINVIGAAWSGVDWDQPLAVGILGGEKLGWFLLLVSICASVMMLAHLSRRPSARRWEAASSALWLAVVGVWVVTNQGTSIGYRVLIALFVVGLVALLWFGMRPDTKRVGGNDGKQD